MSVGRALGLDRVTVAEAVRAACLDELRALKPGNVHVHAGGHDMSVQQFEESATALAEVVARPGLSVGRRIYEAIRLTGARVGCNTNLGIALLTVPLAEAAIVSQGADLQANLRVLLSGLTVDDAGWAFKAIATANPAGLGERERNDVRGAAEISLFEAMAEAADRDRIAYQYVTDYQDVFQAGLPLYQSASARWNDPDWSAALVYLSFLAAFPDTHIMRKNGRSSAERTQQRAAGLLKILRNATDPKSCRSALLEFDQDLKTQGLNPGTSADLTVATLLAARLGDNNILAVEK